MTRFKCDLSNDGSQIGSTVPIDVLEPTNGSFGAWWGTVYPSDVATAERIFEAGTVSVELSDGRRGSIICGGYSPPHLELRFRGTGPLG